MTRQRTDEVLDTKMKRLNSPDRSLLFQSDFSEGLKCRATQGDMTLYTTTVHNASQSR